MAHPLKHFIELSYKTNFTTHKAMLPTLSPATPVPGAVPAYTTWGGDPINGDVMLTDYTALAKRFMQNDSEFLNAVFWATLDGDTKPTALAAAPINVPGDAGYTGWYEAVQRTWSFKTSGFNFLKNVMLDSPTGNAFGRYSGTLDTDGDNFVAYILGDTHAFSGRDLLRPAAFWSLTITLNEKLRREYHLT